MYLDKERIQLSLNQEPIEIPVGLRYEVFNKFIVSEGKCELKNSDFMLSYSTLGMVLGLYLAERHECERFGQWFCNNFIKSPWPELYYETSEDKARKMIEQWLDDNQYIRQMPARTAQNAV